MKFYDANIGVADASKMKGSYSIIDSKFDMPIIIGTGTPTAENDPDVEFNGLKVTRVDADGIEHDVTDKFRIDGANNDKITLTPYVVVPEDPTTVATELKLAWGMKIKPVAIDGAEAGDKLVIVVTHNLKRPYDGEKDAYAGKTVAFEFVIAE